MERKLWGARDFTWLTV